MYEIVLVIIFFIIIIFILCSRKENYAYAPFSAHFFPKLGDDWNSYQQLSLLPYVNPPVGPYTFGWDELQNLKQEYPSQVKIYKLLYPS
jgi:hypothetical protein